MEALAAIRNAEKLIADIIYDLEGATEFEVVSIYLKYNKTVAISVQPKREVPVLGEVKS